MSDEERKFVGVFVAPEDREKEFDVVISCDCRLAVSEIWPDGDAPENPTAEDVAKVMGGYLNAGRLIQDWNLEADVTVDGVDVKF